MASKTKELPTFSLPTPATLLCSAPFSAEQQHCTRFTARNSHHPPVISGCASPQGLAGLGSFIRGTQRFLQLVLSEFSEHRLQSAQDTRAGLVLMMHVGAGAQCDFWAC